MEYVITHVMMEHIGMPHHYHAKDAVLNALHAMDLMSLNVIHAMQDIV